ncbi:MAG TPA: CPBP family intramembrane glutamic endopeptidase [Candidatus Sulfotelmatobacter sp.]|nr:CPBP family intramembrane glutamic endopeptidase [Candidatus Sulfotelmatobacter sp.]
MPVITEIPSSSQTTSSQAPAADSLLALNSLTRLKNCTADGRISWSGPLIVLLSRTAFMLLAQGLFAIIFLIRGAAHPWFAAAPWWTVYATLIDFGCLALMWKFTRREGISLRALIGPIRLRYGRDFFLGLGLLALICPLFVFGGMLAMRLIYGAYPVDVFPGILGGRILPFWAVIYSRFVWWIIWSPTEEMTYAGYVLPRAQALSGRTWLAVLLVGFIWSIQHSFLPFLPEWHNFLWRFLAFVPGCFVLTLLYLHLRRLGPLIVAHWCMDIFATVMTLQ